MNISHQERWHLIELAKRPIRADTGTPYPCTQEDLDYCLRFPRIKPRERLHRMEATYQLTRFNRLTKELSPNERNACKNLKAALKLRDWGPDLIIKAFKDLDQLFFMGRLHGQCLVGWCDPGYRKVSHGEYGVTTFVPPSSAKIMLNVQDVILMTEEPYMEMFRTMLHECWWYVSSTLHGLPLSADDVLSDDLIPFVYPFFALRSYY